MTAICRAVTVGLLLLGSTGIPAVLPAQDTTQAVDRVRVGIEYRPGVRPSVVVLPAANLDSSRAILARDLDYSDRFELLVLPARDSAAGNARGRINYPLYRTLGVEFAVTLAVEKAGFRVAVHDIRGAAVLKEQSMAVPPQSDPGYRMAVHQAADEVVRWISGTPGIAASRLLFLSGRTLWRVDSDGAGLAQISAPGEEILSPAWSPDGSRFAFTMFGRGAGQVMVQSATTGARNVVASTERALNITPAFSPDGRTMAFARADEGGTDIYTADLTANCCVQRLTVGRYSDNLSPTFAPDGRRVAFVSTRAGQPQVYVMAADGTDQELFAPFDFGRTGASNAPEWSPDGASVAFHRDVERAAQIFVLDVASRRVRQLSSAGRNEDPTWAPDGRHLAFVSDRSGRRQLWVIDAVTGRIRQLTTIGLARLPAWSRRAARLGGAN